MTNNGNNSEYTQVDSPIFQSVYEVAPVQSSCNSITYKNKMIIIFKTLINPMCYKVQMMMMNVDTCIRFLSLLLYSIKYYLLIQISFLN